MTIPIFWRALNLVKYISMIVMLLLFNSSMCRLGKAWLRCLSTVAISLSIMLYPAFSLCNAGISLFLTTSIFSSLLWFIYRYLRAGNEEDNPTMFDKWLWLKSNVCRVVKLSSEFKGNVDNLFMLRFKNFSWGVTSHLISRVLILLWEMERNWSCLKVERFGIVVKEFLSRYPNIQLVLKLPTL